MYKVIHEQRVYKIIRLFPHFLVVQWSKNRGDDVTKKYFGISNCASQKMAFLFLRQNKKDLDIEKEDLNSKFALLYLNLTLAYLSLNLALGQNWK